MMTAQDREIIKKALQAKTQFDQRSEKIKEVTNKSLAIKDQYKQAQSDFNQVLSLVSNFEEILSKLKE
ncbi:MAG: hypothetical protein LCH34_12455 [Firmicutes bacterium]|nr:hypothetical protein [Bacillota bacterium]